MASIFSTAVRAIEADHDDSNVEYLIGMKNLRRHAGPRRVVWVSPGGSLEIAPHPGGIDNGTLREASFYADVANVQAHIVAPDLESLETLWLAVVNATRRCLTTASIAGRYQNPTQLQDQSGHVYAEAEARVQLFQWNMRALSESKALTTITTLTETCTIDNTL